MYRRAFLAAAGASALAAASRVVPLRATESGQYGADLDPREFQGVQTFLAPDALRGTYLEVADAFPATASRVILDGLPSVMTQGTDASPGSPGSCEACSFGYCLGGYTAGRTVHAARDGWNSSEPSNAPSAAWLYEWEHVVVENSQRVCPGGSKSVAYAERLLAGGAPSSAQVPYNPHGIETVPGMCGYIESIDLNAHYPGMDRFVIGSYKALRFSDSDPQGRYLELFKDLLRNRHAIGFSGLVARGYKHPELADGAFVAPSGFIPGSGHGQVIVGFDDSIGRDGAFLVQNSFGPSWNPGAGPGSNGRIWWSYEAFFAAQKSALIMFPRPSGDIAGTVLESSGSAPQLTIVDAVVHDTEAKSTLVLVLHAAQPLHVTSLAVRDRQRQFSLRLDEIVRLGYHYISRAPGTFRAGDRYDVAISAQTSGAEASYRGSVILKET